MSEWSKYSLEKEVIALLPQPVNSNEIVTEFKDGYPIETDIEFTGGYPVEVVVKFSEEGISIATFKAFWHGPHELKAKPKQLALLKWSDLPKSLPDAVETIRPIVQKACKLRKATYSTCDSCKETNPPEWMHNENTCQACAEKQGVVY